MPILHLGVIDVPYTTASAPAPAPSRAGARKARRAGARKTSSSARNVTTGDVAGWLENRYHVMEHYWALHEADAAKAAEVSLLGSVESLMMGAPVVHDPFGGMVSVVEDTFKQMIAKKELDALGFPGIPTKAAQEGRTARTKSKRGPPRPSFFYSGLYSASFKAWVTGT